MEGIYRVTEDHKTSTVEAKEGTLVQYIGPSESNIPEHKGMAMIKRFNSDERRPFGKAFLVNPHFLASANKDEDYFDEPSAEEKDDATGDSTTFVFESLCRVTKYHQVGKKAFEKGELVTYQRACMNQSKNVISGMSVSSLVYVKVYDADKRKGTGRNFLANKEYLTSASVDEVAKKKGETASKSKSRKEVEEMEDAEDYDDEDNYHEPAAFDPDQGMDIVKEEEMNEVSATKRGGGGGNLSEPPKKKQAVTKAPSSMSSVTATPQETKPSAVVVTNAKDSKTAPVSSAVTDTTVKNAGAPAPAAAAKDDEVTAALQLKPTAVLTAKDNTAKSHAVADTKDQVPVTPGEFPSKHYAFGWKVVPEGTQSLCGNFTAKETTYVSSRGEMQTHQPQDWQVGQEREHLREQERLREDTARTETSRQGNTLDLEREYREYLREQERRREEAARAEASQGNTSTQGMMEGLSSLYSSAKAKGSGWFGSAKAKVSAKLFPPPQEDPPGSRFENKLGWKPNYE